MKNTQPALKLITLAIAATLSPQAFAKTTYVEVFGSKGNECTKTLPCLTIQEGIDKAGAKGRVIVGPGRYTEAETTGLTINQEGVKVTSVAGAHATVISVGETAVGVSIENSKVTFGQKKQGFRFEATAGNTSIFSLGNGNSKIRIEGNILVAPAPDDNTKKAIVGANQSATSIRSNVIMGWDEAMVLLGTAGTTKEKFLITDNQMETHRCITLESMSAGHASKILGNRGNCRYFLYLDNTDSGLSAKTNEKIEKNTILSPTIGGTAISVTQGNPSISSNLIKNTSSGVSLRSTAGASIRNNLIIDSSFEAIDLSDNGDQIPVDATTVIGNSIVDLDNPDSEAGAIVIENVVPKTISNNNLLGSDICPINLRETTPVAPIVAKKNFWDERNESDGTVDLSGCSSFTTDAAAALTPLLTFAPATKANPVKYKSSF